MHLFLHQNLYVTWLASDIRSKGIECESLCWMVNKFSEIENDLHLCFRWISGKSVLAATPRNIVRLTGQCCRKKVLNDIEFWNKKIQMIVYFQVAKMTKMEVEKAILRIIRAVTKGKLITGFTDMYFKKLCFSSQASRHGGITFLSSVCLPNINIGLLEKVWPTCSLKNFCWFLEFYFLRTVCSLF